MTLRYLLYVPWPAALAVAALAAALGLALAVRPGTLSVGDVAPDFSGSRWYNHEPTTLEALRRDAVVLLEFFGSG